MESRIFGVPLVLILMVLVLLVPTMVGMFTLYRVQVYTLAEVQQLRLDMLPEPVVVVPVATPSAEVTPEEVVEPTQTVRFTPTFPEASEVGEPGL